MRVFLFLILFFTSIISFSQCHDLLSEKLNNADILPYALYDKLVFESKLDRPFNIKLDNVAFKTKLLFLFQSDNLGDSLDVSLITLNRKIIQSKIITKQDCTLRCEPLRKTENYFLIVKYKPVLDEFNKPIPGCLGVAILERVKSKPFRRIQKIKWKKNYK